MEAVPETHRMSEEGEMKDDPKIYRSCNYFHNGFSYMQFVVLVLAGTELIFVLGAAAVLCFGLARE